MVPVPHRHLASRRRSSTAGIRLFFKFQIPMVSGYNDLMEPSQQLIDQLYVDKVLAARRRSLQEKFLAAGHLHEAVIDRMRAGILMQNPSASEEQVASELKRRFAIARLLEHEA
jgi:hypothetical protein